jgi:aspartate ammonia-lyase
MSTQIAEEAARLRASAASSLVQNEFDLKEIQRKFGGFKILSATSDELADNELKVLLATGESVTKLIQQTITNLTMAGSAIGASGFPTDAASKITAMITQVDNARSYLEDAESDMSKFKDADKFSDQKSILETVQMKVSKILEELNNAGNQLHLLLFSGSQP